MGELPGQKQRRRACVVLQTSALFAGSVVDNVLHGPRLRGDCEGPGDADAACAQAAGQPRRAGLPAAFGDKPVRKLSGGEAQRVSLARGLANEPEVLPVEEPDAACDPTAGRVSRDLLVRLATDTHLTFVFVIHDLAQARRIGDHGLLLVDGRVVDLGSLPALLDDSATDLTRQSVVGRLQNGAAGALPGAASPRYWPPRPLVLMVETIPGFATATSARRARPLPGALLLAGSGHRRLHSGRAGPDAGHGHDFQRCAY